jgi:ArsR family transcriptional regulator
MIVDTSTDVNTLWQNIWMELPPQCCPVMTDLVDEERASEMAAGFAALSDPTRLRLLNMIATGGEVCSCTLLEPLGKSQPTISHHTKVLAEAGLIRGEKRGRWVWWTVVPERVDQLRATLATEPATVA